MIDRLKKKIIVSCQASIDEPFYKLEPMEAMVRSVLNGGAGGLRLASPKHITMARKITDLPIIGLTKPEIIPENFKEIVYITPTKTDAQRLATLGADFIAIDATKRRRPDNLKDLIDYIHQECKKPVIGDISTLNEAENAFKLGCDIVATTLSGYTSYSKESETPDFDLLKDIVENIHCPVIMEGRITDPSQVKEAFQIGATAVVIGSIITRPHYITRRFVEQLQ